MRVMWWTGRSPDGAADRRQWRWCPVFGAVVDQNGEEGVILVGSFLGEDRTYTFWIFDAPGPGADPQVRGSQRATG